MSDGFMNTPEPITLPITIVVADQNPIFLARDEVVDIMKREDKEETGSKKSNTTR
jgi:hypothetical protein